MKRTACLYAINNGVGLTADVSLIQNLLIDEYDITVTYTHNNIDTVSYTHLRAHET